MRAAVRSLAELGDLELVWIDLAVEHAVGHLDGRSGTALCGTRVDPTPIVAGHLRTLFGKLCPSCWGNSSRWPHPRRSARNRREVEQAQMRQAVNKAHLADRTPQTRDLFEEYRQVQQGQRWTR